MNESSFSMHLGYTRKGFEIKFISLATLSRFCIRFNLTAFASAEFSVRVKTGLLYIRGPEDSVRPYFVGICGLDFRSKLHHGHAGSALR